MTDTTSGKPKPVVYLTVDHEASAHHMWTACVDDTSGRPEFDGSGPDPLTAAMALARELYDTVYNMRPVVDAFHELEPKFIAMRDELRERDGQAHIVSRYHDRDELRDGQA